ncbi:hypothetical protein [Bradyrhizobium sp. NC92]|uniref:hypothetical protein n=1 Tax=Bradyrhizobium sp. (strain NC92) TaxID=55395 RepID=UPI0021AAE94A|nr:hypothetical protein [Bradyrhizobium sp. NC92]UWU68199.1 hypothetical protein N2602_34730 [Bradyrhizobium sp. NC92]
MDKRLLHAIEGVKAEFLDAEIFRHITDELSAHLFYLSYQLSPPRSAHLRLLKTYDPTIHVVKKFFKRARVSISAGLAIRAFYFANAVARTIDGLIPIDIDLDRYPSSARGKIEDGHKRILKMLRFGIFGPVLPPQKWRQILIYTLMYKSLEWTLVHESAHIMRGHLEMPNKLRNAPWVSQLIESQSDDFATLRFLITLRHFEKEHNYGEEPWQKNWAHFAFCKKSDRLNIELIAMILSIALVGKGSDENFLKTPPSPDLPWEPYPPAAYRIWRVMNLLTTPVSTNPGMPPLDPLDPKTDGILPAETLYSYVGGLLEKVSIDRQGPMTRLMPMHQSIIREYDRALMSNLAPVAAYETRWMGRNLDPTRHPPNLGLPPDFEATRQFFKKQTS